MFERKTIRYHYLVWSLECLSLVVIFFVSKYHQLHFLLFIILLDCTKVNECCSVWGQLAIVIIAILFALPPLGLSCFQIATGASLFYLVRFFTSIHFVSCYHKHTNTFFFYIYRVQKEWVSWCFIWVITSKNRNN